MDIAPCVCPRFLIARPRLRRRRWARRGVRRPGVVSASGGATSRSGQTTTTTTIAARIRLGCIDLPPTRRAAPPTRTGLMGQCGEAAAAAVVRRATRRPSLGSGRPISIAAARRAGGDGRRDGGEAHAVSRTLGHTGRPQSAIIREFIASDAAFHLYAP